VKLELHADDIGASNGVNRNILSAWKNGAVDGVSVLANGDAVEAAAVEINKDPDRPLRVVAHLNLSEAGPMAAAADVPLLLNDHGKLRYGFLGLWLRWLTVGAAEKQELSQQITQEWRAQIEAIRSTFSPRRIDGLDGHIHIHMLPFTFEIAAQLAKEFGIEQIRISSEIRHFSMRDTWRFGCLANVVKHQLLRTLALPARRIAREYGLSSPGAVAGLLYSGRMSPASIEAAASAARRARLDWLEVICHPGRALPEEESRWEAQPGLAGFYISPDRDFEYQTLVSVASAREGQ
jgi:predicted glycoside hydrolase/deacetylase ChbG (UPF0249 family)